MGNECSAEQNQIQPRQPNEMTLSCPDDNPSFELLSGRHRQQQRAGWQPNHNGLLPSKASSSTLKGLAGSAYPPQNHSSLKCSSEASSESEDKASTCTQDSTTGLSSVPIQQVKETNHYATRPPVVFGVVFSDSDEYKGRKKKGTC